MSTNPKSGLSEAYTPLIHPECDKSSTLVQPVSYATDEKISDKISNKDDKGFLFDVIVVRLDILNKTIDQSSKLLVEANFNGKNLSITSSRINVLDFKYDRGIEFVANPLKLKEQLTRNPLTLKVTDVTDVIGYGRVEWPKEFLLGVIESDREMINSFEIELRKCDETKTGTMQLIVRLQPKCKEYEEAISQNEKIRNANKEIEPNDVIFVVSEEKNTCCCSQIGIIPASESNHDLQPKCLDLSNFHAVNSQNLNNTDILATLDPECLKLKTVTSHYKKLIDAKKTEYSHKEKDGMLYTIPSQSCLKLNLLPTTSDCYRMPAPCPSDNRAFSAKNIKIPHLECPPELIENEPQTFRSCPLCKQNMEYLPKLSACPNCCYKPIPYFEEKPYDDSQSADQIIKEFHNKLQTNDNSESDTNSKDPLKCRCTCKYGFNKPCAHCRIRKLCENIFQPPLPTIKSKDICEPKSSDIHCVSSSDNRPFLTRIFSELKDLYDIEEPKRKEIEIDERCEKELNKKPTTRNHLTMKNEIKTKMQTGETDEAKEISEPQKSRKRRKRPVKPASDLAVRSKLYDYQFVRQNFPNKFGHKACMNGYAGRKNVPPNMGWLWNINNSGKWKPGTIRKPIKELMRYFLKDFPADTLLVSQYSYRKSKSRCVSDPCHKTLVQKPTLHIQKKDGEYIITMRPLKRREILKDSADPYENMKPVQFRIVKNPQLRTIRDLKKSLKSMSFKKCTCHRPITYCYCRSFLEKKRLEYQCRKECCKRQIESCCDTLILSDTSDSEAEFDFGVTPPVGLIKPEKLKKINLVNVSTQYDELDWNPMPLFPRPPNKYMQMYQCAVGERKDKAPMNGSSGDIAMNGVDIQLRRGSFPREASKGLFGARGGGDGFLMGKGTAKGGAVAIGFSGKYVGRGGPAGPVGLVGPAGPTGTALVAPTKKAEDIPKKKVDMFKYIIQTKKKMSKISTDQGGDKRKGKMNLPTDANKRKEKMNLLKGVNPPLLCMVDRLGKPVDPCAPCLPRGDYRVC